MAIQQFVNHIEGMQSHHTRAQQRSGNTPNDQPHAAMNMSADLIKLKNILKQAMAQKERS